MSHPRKDTIKENKKIEQSFLASSFYLPPSPEPLTSNESVAGVAKINRINTYEQQQEEKIRFLEAKGFTFTPPFRSQMASMPNNPLFRAVTYVPFRNHMRKQLTPEVQNNLATRSKEDIVTFFNISETISKTSLCKSDDSNGIENINRILLGTSFISVMVFLQHYFKGAMAPDVISLAEWDEFLEKQAAVHLELFKSLKCFPVGLIDLVAEYSVKDADTFPTQICSHIFTGLNSYLPRDVQTLIADKAIEPRPTRGSIPSSSSSNSFWFKQPSAENTIKQTPPSSALL